MNKIIFIISVVGAVAFASACNNSGSNNNSKQPLVVAKTDDTIKYQCPMKCEGDTSYTTTGQCPVCEMDLEKVDE